MTETTHTLRAVLRQRLRRELARAGRQEALEVAERAAGEVLGSELLDPEEEALLEDLGQAGDEDPVATLIGRRFEHALRAGTEAAGVAADELETFEVIVLRSQQGGPLNRVLARLIQHIAQHRKGGTGQILLITTDRLHRKIQQILPSGSVHEMVDGEDASDDEASVAVDMVSAEVSLESVETRATTLLARLRGEEPDDVALRAAWVVGGLDSIEDEPSTAGEPEAVPVPAVLPGAEDDPLIGQLFHLKYRIVRRIGKGGFGAVYEARDERGAGNRVAIKVLSGKAATSAGQQQSFKDEARRVTRLSHPNIVDWKVFDETDEGLPYFVMELVEGEEFEKTLRREHRIEPDRAARLLLQVLDALRAAHHLSRTESILHLDLKPSNLFHIPSRQGRQEQLKVIDFGIGQYIGDGVVEESGQVVPAEGLAAEEVGISGTLTFVRPEGSPSSTPGVHRSKGCTPEYASPEQSAHVLYEPEIRALDGRSDLYSLGVVAFEMLTGQLPFKAKSRLDVLRMHREDPAPSVGSMGVKIPRRLARFVDRCLRKDPDERWKDTNEAHEALHRIVHPPAWHAVAKVTVPVVLVALAFGSWALATRELRIPTVGIAAEDGRDLATAPLFLGPGRDRARLSLVTRDDAIASGAGTWEVVRAADARALEGWTAGWAEAGVVDLVAPAGLDGRREERVELRLDGDAARSQPFQLIWIGPGTWSVTDIEVGGVRLDDLEGRGIDPLGTSVDLWVEGDARADLAEVALRVGSGASFSMAPGPASGERLHYRVDLADLALAEGPNEVRWSVRDGAGETWERTTRLEVVPGPVALASVRLVDHASSSAADGREPEVNRLLDAYLIGPRTEPVLRVEVARPADVTWKVLVEGAEQPEMLGSGQGKQSHAFELGGLLDLRGGDPFRGRIEVRVSEDPYVVHARESERGRAVAEVAFRVDDLLPEFLAQWRATDPPGVPADLHGASTLFTNARSAEVVLARRQPVPMRVEVAWWPEGSEDAVRTNTSETLVNPQVTQAVLPVELDAEGAWVLALRSFRFDAAAGVTGARPDVEVRIPLVVDRVAPRARIVGFQAGQVVRDLAELPATIGVAFAGSPAALRDAPIDLSWRLERPGRSSPSFGGESPSCDPAAGEAQVSLGEALRDPEQVPDGLYRLSVRGTDHAGNRLTEASVQAIFSRSGPALRLDEPAGVGRWRRDASSGRWPVRARASDPNGVASVECALVHGETRVPVELTREPGGSDEDPVLIGSVVLPYTLSEARVRLSFDAVDGQGTASHWLSPEFELPEIARPSPERVAVVFGRHAIESMRRVEGNHGFQYLFGGRGDEVENTAFVAAGLAPFNEAPRRTRPRSWQVPFAVDAIEDFYLDEHEVSVAQYLEFLRDPDGYALVEHWPEGREPDAARARALAARLEALDGEEPVSGVRWPEARAYAHWAGKRLPTWGEWEYAVRLGAEYEPHATFALGADGPAIVGKVLARGATWTADGHFADLCDGVSEWTSTSYERAGQTRYPHLWAAEDPTRLLVPSESADRYWVVGGNRQRTQGEFSVADHRPVDHEDETIGFRCAISASELLRRLGSHDPQGPNFEERER